MSEGSTIAANDVSEVMPEDFNPDDLYTLKALFLELEKVGLGAWGGGERYWVADQALRDIMPWDLFMLFCYITLGETSVDLQKFAVYIVVTFIYICIFT